jgi:hypothetical protein
MESTNIKYLSEICCANSLSVMILTPGLKVLKVDSIPLMILEVNFDLRDIQGLLELPLFPDSLLQDGSVSGNSLASSLLLAIGPLAVILFPTRVIKYPVALLLSMDVIAIILRPVSPFVNALAVHQSIFPPTAEKRLVGEIYLTLAIWSEVCYVHPSIVLSPIFVLYHSQTQLIILDQNSRDVFIILEDELSFLGVRIVPFSLKGELFLLVFV